MIQVFINWNYKNVIHKENLMNKYYYKFIFKIFLIKIFFMKYFFLLLKTNRNNNTIRVGLCTVGKLENNYIKEFIIYYEKFGVDKIYLYDNNDLNGEKFEEVIYEYINNNYVKLINYRGKTRMQLKIYDHCYKTNYKQYDWLIFIDIDEFINLKNINKIKNFLSQKKFNNCKSIFLNWVIHTDNNLLYYENKSIINRFPEKYTVEKYCIGKTIIRGNIKTYRTHSCHTLDKRIQKCNSIGKKINFKKFCRKPDFKKYYIDHYRFKSTEEFIEKIIKGDCRFGNDNKNKLSRIRKYFKYNKITAQKIHLIENKTGFNIPYYIKKIN